MTLPAGPSRHTDAARYTEHLKRVIADIPPATEWARAGVAKDAMAGHLRRRGIPTDPARLDRAFRDAADEHPTINIAATNRRAALILTHPHLTREDRDAIIAAGLTLLEVDRLILTGTYDRDKVALLGALT